MTDQINRIYKDTLFGIVSFEKKYSQKCCKDVIQTNRIRQTKNMIIVILE